MIEDQIINDPGRVSGNLKSILTDIFHFHAFRPHQQKVCESVIEGKDLLLVMPTGAGKSLCYQLPGIARKGVTLVISPLIALMEDQTAGLKQKGFRADRIHSGLTRLKSRQICREYLDGKLDFFFMAPERLAVPGFPEMLAKGKPSLVAIDEAHCISQWGHDFRPDYRLLGERLPLLRPAPFIAMTATATPRVQTDIVRQLRMDRPELRIHGFRRTNIAIELVEIPPADRTRKVIEILKADEHRPAIIYAPTRQKTENLAKELSHNFKAAPYHAGLAPEIRDGVQAAFLSEKMEIIVATIAFGMGIDKPNIRTVIHTALPGSLEGYYQEIGRAGRDGKPSRAVLLHAYGDRRVHQFFHEKNYPHEKILDRIYKRLKKERIPLENLAEALNLEEEEFDTALEKLRIHGGARAEPDKTVRRGHDHWLSQYRAQRDHRLSQLEEISRFAGSSSCRMLHLIQYFGDCEDDGHPCGICDFCAPENAIGVFHRNPDKQEEKIIWRTMSKLKQLGSLSTGKLFKAACPDAAISRSDFESLLRALAGALLITLREDAFEKNGKRIHYRRAEITGKGKSFRFEVCKSLRLSSLKSDRRTTRRKALVRRKKGGE